MKERLKKLRESVRLTQRDFGAKIGVSDKVVSKWERGASEPDICTLMKISETYCVGLEELIGSPRRTDVAFPARKAEKGVLFYTVFVAASLIFVAVAIAFCVLYAAALREKATLARPVKDAATCFIPIVFGVENFCVFAAVSQIRFKAFQLYPCAYSKGKTLNEILLMPCSIRKAYAVYGKWLAFFYSFVQLWSTLNIVAYIFSIDSVLRYSLTGVLLSCVVFATIAAGFSLKRIVEQDSAAKEFFEDRRDRKAVNL